METADQKTKEQLCKEILEKIFIEAEDEASELFIEYPETLNIEFDCSVDDKITTAKRLLYLENVKYNKILNIRSIEKAKAHYLGHFVRTNEIYDKQMKFNIDGYDAQKRAIIEQILVMKKTEYLRQTILEQNKIIKIETVNINQPNPDRIKWNRNPSEFGFMVLQLVQKGYIELPTGQTAEGSYEKLAGLLFNIFDVTDSWRTFKDALNPYANALSDTKRSKLEDFPEEYVNASELGHIIKRKISKNKK